MLNRLLLLLLINQQLGSSLSCVLVCCASFRHLVVCSFSAVVSLPPPPPITAANFAPFLSFDLFLLQKSVRHLLQTLFLTEKVGQKVSKKKKKCLSCVMAFFVWSSSSSFGNRSRTDTVMCLLFSSASQRKCVCLAAFSSLLFEFINFLLLKLLLLFLLKNSSAGAHPLIGEHESSFSSPF